MTQPDFVSWLNRKPAGPSPKKPLPRVTKKRAKENRQYNARVKVWLTEHPVCEVWCKENGFKWVAPGIYHSLVDGKQYPGVGLIYAFEWLAPRATQCHHRNKRRKSMLLDERYWLAVCDENHKRIEENKSWARANGFLLNF